MNDADALAHLRGFFVAWRAVAAREPLSFDRLSRFLISLGPLLSSPSRTSAVTVVPDQTALATAFHALSAPLARARDDGFFINPWATAGLKRAEVRNSAVLAALWTPNSGGAAAIAFLDAFMRRLEPGDGRSLPSLEALGRGYVVRTEHCPIGEISERVDLTIEGERFLLGIEVKIGAAEGPAQLERYVRAIDERAAAHGKEAFVIFLAPRPPVANASAASYLSRVIPAKWSDVAAAARTSIPKRQSERSFNHRLIDSFASHVAGF